MKFLKIISLLPFLTQIRQKCGPNCPSNVTFLATFALNFHSDLCAGFQWSMLGDSININNFNWNTVVQKSFVSGPTCAKMGSPWAKPKTKKQFFFQKYQSKITKPDDCKPYKNCLFYQSIIICFGWVINVFPFCMMLCC